MGETVLILASLSEPFETTVAFTTGVGAGASVVVVRAGTCSSPGVEKSIMGSDPFDEQLHPATILLGSSPVQIRPSLTRHVISSKFGKTSKSEVQFISRLENCKLITESNVVFGRWTQETKPFDSEMVKQVGGNLELSSESHRNSDTRITITMTEMIFMLRLKLPHVEQMLSKVIHPSDTGSRLVVEKTKLT